MRSHDHHNLLEIFDKYLERQRKGSKRARLILVIVFAAIIVGLSFIPAKTDEDKMWKMAILVFFALVAVFTVIMSMREMKKYDPESSPILQAIKYKNQDNYFTWIYPLKHIYNGVPSYYLVFMSAKKKRYQIRLVSEEEFQIINSIQPVITNVTYGFSEDLKRKFKKDPKALLVHTR